MTIAWFNANYHLVASQPHVGGHVHDREFEGMRFAECTFVGGARSCTFRNVEIQDCRVEGCFVESVLFDDCVIANLKNLTSARGRVTLPLWATGVFARHLTLKGRIPWLNWFPPHNPDPAARTIPEAVVRAADAFYREVDWAVDISEARFLSDVNFSFGPPGDLIRRDPTTQPLVTRERLLETPRWRDHLGESHWLTLKLQSFLDQGWPSSRVFSPRLGAPKAAREESIQEFAILWELGLAD